MSVIPAGTPPRPFLAVGMILRCPFFTGRTWRVEAKSDREEPRWAIARSVQTPVVTWKGPIHKLKQWTLAEDHQFEDGRDRL
jgi:hypothetical protein